MSLPPTALDQTGDGRWYVVNQTPTGVFYWDLPDLYREEYTERGRELTRVVDVRWNQKQQFLYDMLGFPLIYPNGANDNIGLLRRTIPDQFPASKVPDMWCVGARLIQSIGTPCIDPQTGAFDYYILQDEDPYQGNIEPPGGFNQDGQNGTPGTIDNPIGPAPPNVRFGYARYALTYRKPLYDLLTDEQIDALQTDPDNGPIGELNRYVERRGEYAVENLTIPGHALYWQDLYKHEGILKEVGQELVRRDETKLLVYIWQDVPEVPEDAIDVCLDTLNSTTFDGKYPPGTLLFQAPKKERYEAATGLILWRIVYSWLYRANGHNVAYRPTIETPLAILSPGYYQIFNGQTPEEDGGGMYKYADHNTLFQVPPP